MIGERVHRLVYALLAALVGVPTLALMVPMLAFVLVVLAAELATPGALAAEFAFAPTATLALVLVAAAAPVGWFVLSGHYLIGGRRALKDAGGGWWAAMFVGIAASVAVMVVVSGKQGLDALTQARWSWLLGPALLLPAAYLSLLRLRG